ncbi:MAG: FAD:protein FMN transferase [Myxococcaceae bacterium]|nr:FAD:protein FMN transferase [Myxococcaceae bacterium]
MLALAVSVQVALAAPGDVVLEKAAVVRRAKEAMHAKVIITIANAKPSDALDEAFAVAFGVFEKIDTTMNEWRPDSPLSRINAGAGVEAVEAPAELCAVLKLALDGAKRTNGLFDPTWAALRDVWRFTGSVEQALPAPDVREAACQRVSYKDVELRPKPKGGGACTVKLKQKGMALGLGGFVKGWGIDQASAELKKRGYRDFFVQVGGDLYVSGKNGERGWKVAIREPRGAADATFARGELSDTAFSTSGDYEKFFMNEGKRYHHLIDLRTCLPATASVSATVMAKTAADAEVLTKAVFVLGGEEGLKLAKGFGAAAVIVAPDGKVFASEELKSKLDLGQPAGF